MVDQCNAITTSGKPCRGRPLPGGAYCMSHDPAYAERRAEGQRKGGEARANARRAVRQWAAIGEQMTAADLPAILRAAMLAVRDGSLEPSQAQAIATLAKTSVSIANEIELEERIAALEAAAGLGPGTVRRIA